jgi:GT2 family glycosyltransferase/Flp pilus assembly protein TadD/SAM-dependent methyltransferase
MLSRGLGVGNRRERVSLIMGKAKTSKQDKDNGGIRPICIAGMHRSGTSMVAQLLHNCGLYLGRQEDILGPAPDNQDGFWENVHFVHLNDEILKRFGGAWDFPPMLKPGWNQEPFIMSLQEPAKKLIQTFTPYQPWGWKDPRNSLTASFWEQALGKGKVKYVICQRNPLEVARSIYKRNFNSFAFSFNLWLSYHKAIIDQTRPDQRIITHYESFFRDPEGELKRLLNFLNLKASDQMVATACGKVARNLRHHSLKKEDLLQAGASQELITFYEASCENAGPVFNANTSDGISMMVPKDLSSRPINSEAVLNPGVSSEKENAPVKGLVSIIILTFNQLQYTKECVESILQHTREPYEIIFVDNGSSDGSIKWLREKISKEAHWRLIENNSNLGFARGCNQGIAASAGEYILLLNNDVVVTEDWLSGMLECLGSDPHTGIIGPVTNNISGLQKDAWTTYETIKEMHGYAAIFKEKNRHRRIPLRRIVGFCMLFRRSLVEAIGMLDENFGTGNFEDDDYCLRASLGGYRNLIAGDVFIHHYGSRTFIGNKIDFKATMGGHRKVFSEKWSNIPRSSEVGKKLLALGKLENAEELKAKGEFTKAAALCIEGIGEFPDEPLFYQSLAAILLEDKQYSEALEAIASIPEESRNGVRNLVLIGYCQEGLDLDAEASESADKILARDPDQTEALNLKGRLAFKSGDLKMAEDYYLKAMAFDPGYGEPYTNLGVLKWTEGLKEEGFSFLERGFILSPQKRDVATLYHTAVNETGDFKRGENIFQEAKAFYPQDQRIAFLLIDLLLKQEKEQEAMEIIEEVMASFELSDGLLQAALAVRDKIGPKSIKKGNLKSLSFSMIAKNEERFIAKCLRSVKPIADEMIVVDTGSTDRTKEIARAFGARVLEFPWTGDFSEARNFSLSQAEGGWIFSLDADEVIASVDYVRIREIVEKSKPTAFKVVTRNYSTEVGAQGFTANIGEYPMEESGLGWFPSTKVRLFPNHGGIRFENPVHEFVEGTIGRAGVPLKDSPIPVHHYGRLDNKKLKEKGEAYYELGKKKLKEKGEKDLKAIFELGIQAGELKRYEEAADLFERLVQMEPLYPLAQFNLGFAYLELGRFPEALFYSQKGYELDPEKKECVINLSHCEIVVGDVAKAGDLLHKVILKEPDYPPALALQSVVYTIKGDDTGIQILQDLKSRKFDCRKLLHEIAESLTRAGRFEQAFRVFELIVKSGNLQENTKKMLEECHRTCSRSVNPNAEISPPKGLNPYEKELSPADIEAQKHRIFVGGLWDEVGRLQFNFLKDQGLRPFHSLVDVGCGALRGGLHFIRYLNPGHYFGIDMNTSLIEAAYKELKQASLQEKKPTLLINEAFEMVRFQVAFDFAIAVSVFTHLPMNHIIRCLTEIKKVLKPAGIFYATFFEAPGQAFTGNISHDKGGVVTHYDSDPFHYAVDEMAYMASIAGLKVEFIGEWNHPRNQKMLSFTRKDN